MLLIGPLGGWLLGAWLTTALAVAVGVVVTAILAVASIGLEVFATPGVGPRLAERLNIRFIPAQRHNLYRSPRVARHVERGAAGHRQRAIAHLETLAGDRSAGRTERRDAASALAELRRQATTPLPPEIIRVDVMMISDFGLSGGTTTSNLTEIATQSAAGLSTVLVHNRNPDFLDEGIDLRVRAALDDRTRLFDFGSRYECDVLVIKYPPSARELPDLLERVTVSGEILVIVNQTPLTGYHGDSKVVYRIDECVAEIERVFDKAPLWMPVGPSVRTVLERHHSDELSRIRWSADDWYELIDVDTWQRERRPVHDDGRIVIGRHGRDSVWKWPANRDDILAAYPDDPNVQVEILGGAVVPRRLLKRLPGNWNVRAFGSLSPQEFLAGLDAFVYFPHPDMTEAFGRTIVEALAVGVPVVTDERFTGLFGDAINVATPHDSMARVRELLSDPAVYEEAVQRGRRWVLAHCDVHQHLERLRGFGLSR